jgi:hypothetical protein
MKTYMCFFTWKLVAGESATKKFLGHSQRSYSGECIRIVTHYIHFLTCFLQKMIRVIQIVSRNCYIYPHQHAFTSYKCFFPVRVILRVNNATFNLSLFSCIYFFTTWSLGWCRGSRRETAR